MSFLYILLSSLVALDLTIFLYKLSLAPRSLPPSPMWLPFIGHLLSLPSRDEHAGFLEMSQRLGSSIFSLRIFGTSVIVLNSLEDVVNLLDKRSSIYSDRICPPMLAEPSLTNWGGFVGFLNYNSRWQKSRRLMHPWLHKKAVEELHSTEPLQTRLLIRRLILSSGDLTTSEGLEAEFYIALSATLAHYVYGYTTDTSTKDPMISELKLATNNFITAALPANFLVNVFPSLASVPGWLPGAGWKRTANLWREQQERAVDSAYQWTKTQMAQGTNKTSIVSSLLSHASDLGLSAEEADSYIKQLAITLFVAGPDTITSTLLIFVLAMLRYPEVQKRAQLEIDAVVDLDRLPSLEDRPNLEYVERLVEEVLRWRPIAPLGVPHATSEDDVYGGYHIPKGAMLMRTYRAITRDEEVYKAPENFDPDRYLDPRVPCPPTFGFGRRACPGLHYAKTSLFLTISSILATFDITCVKDGEGSDIMPTLESANQVPYHPKPFRVNLVPRLASRVEFACTSE
ncbi:cytochrome P450 family protein [Ceratobasidium sp. AG-Ba]|nr:cytochrome P450 family protein [Ceratobasidium sp. AG-Ba]